MHYHNAKPDINYLKPHIKSRTAACSLGNSLYHVALKVGVLILEGLERTGYLSLIFLKYN